MNARNVVPEIVHLREATSCCKAEISFMRDPHASLSNKIQIKRWTFCQKIIKYLSKLAVIIRAASLQRPIASNKLPDVSSDLAFKLFPGAAFELPSTSPLPSHPFWSWCRAAALLPTSDGTGLGFSRPSCSIAVEDGDEREKFSDESQTFGCGRFRT